MIKDKGKLTPRKQDWIDLFLEYTKGIPSPRIFRLWSAITAIGGTLERRVFTYSTGEQLYPNLFVLFVAPPGIGKTQAIKRVHELWRLVPDLIVSPDNITKAALVDAVADASRKIVRSPTELLEYNSMQIAADELGVLLPAHDLDFLSVLNKLFDCPPFYTERRRTIKIPIDIPNPQVTILAGTQPGFMAEIFPETAWGMGFTSRLIMIYAGKQVKVPLNLFYDEDAADQEMKAKNLLKKQLLSELKTMLHLFGRFRFDQGAAVALEQWHSSGGRATEPQHSKLEHYNARRTQHLLKLCMVASVSRSNEMLITLEDYHRALNWLLEAEETMPDVFRNMTQRSDTQTLQELHFYCWQIYAKEKKSVHEQRIFNFLSTRVPSDRIEKILDIADRAGIVKRVAGTQTWKPAPKNAVGME